MISRTQEGPGGLEKNKNEQEGTLIYSSGHPRVTH